MLAKYLGNKEAQKIPAQLRVFQQKSRKLLKKSVELKMSSNRFSAKFISYKFKQRKQDKDNSHNSYWPSYRSREEN